MSARKLKVGDKVLINGSELMGHVRFIGEVSFSQRSQRSTPLTLK